MKGKAYAEANQDKVVKLKDQSSHDEDSDQAIAVPVKPKTSKAPLKEPKKQVVKENSRQDKIPGPSRTFSGVFPPSLKEVTAKAKRGLMPSNHSGRGARRHYTKSIIIDSDSDEDASRSSGKGEEDDYVNLSGGEDSSPSSFEEEQEESSEDGIISISEDESDVPRTKKTKSVPVKKPAKAPKEAAPKRGQKRKSDEMDSERDNTGRQPEPPQKKSKVVKPKKDRVSMDPWHLGHEAVQKDWTQMQAPPLDMFHFHRLVIDEFTYTKKEHVSHAIVTQLSANCRWVMSGTPPTGDFASVKGIAAFLGIHLGIDDDAEGSTEEVKSRIQDKTAAEAFHSFRDVRTPYWHSARHDIAQKFLNRFVRQVSISATRRELLLTGFRIWPRSMKFLS